MGLVSFGVPISQGVLAPAAFHIDVTQRHMKTLKSLITACIAIFALSSVAFALPPGKDGAQLPTLTKKSQFEELKSGDKVELVCKMCDTVKVIDIRDAKEVIALCNEAGWFIVPSARRNTRSRGLPPANPVDR